MATTIRRRRARRFLVWLVPVLALAAFALAPSVLAPWVSAALTARAGVPVRVGWISWNPFSARVTLHSVRIAPGPDDPPAITLGAVRIELALGSLLAGEVVVRRLVLDHPWVALRRTPAGDVDLAALVSGVAAPAGAPAPVRVLRVGTLRIVGGSVEFRDETATPALETSLHLEHASADDVSLSLGGPVALRLHLESRLERQPLQIDVGYQTSGEDSTLEATLAGEGVSLARAMLYVPLGWQQVSGTLDLTLAYTRQVVGGRLRRHVLHAAGTLREVALAEPWAPAATVRARRVRLQAVDVDFLRRRTELGGVDIDDFQAVVPRGPSGVHVPMLAGAGDADTAWRTTLSRVALGAGTIVLRDVVPGADPEITVAVRSGTARTVGDALVFSLAGELGGGRVALEGRARGGTARARLVLDGVALPELADRLRLPVRFATGRIAAELQTHIGAGPATLAGRVRLAGGRTRPPEPARPEEVLAWQELTLEIIDATLDPLQLHLATLDVAWPYVMIYRSGAGVFPWGLGTRGDDAPGTVPRPEATDAGAPPGAPPVLVIERVAAHDGRIEYYDTTFDPPYWTELADATLDATHLGWSPFACSHLELAGAVDELAPLALQGTIAAGESTLRLRAERLRLAPLSPLLEPLLHYRIGSGVARLDSTIAVRDTSVEAENALVLSRLAMSAAGDERFAGELGAPLSVALTLMKDHRGDIHLDLPIRGDVGTRRYEVRRVLETALRQALVAAARAPLTLLGSVFRHDEGEQFDLSPVPFPPARAELDSAGEARIAQVARLLGRHTELHVVLIPEPSPADAASLRDQALVTRLEQLGPARSTRDDLLLAFLRARLHGASPAPPPADASAAPSVSLSAALEELEGAIPLPLERLAGLSAARAEAVARRLVEGHGIDAGRIERMEWEPAEPRPETIPGVDLQLRSG